MSLLFFVYDVRRDSYESVYEILPVNYYYDIVKNCPESNPRAALNPQRPPNLYSSSLYFHTKIFFISVASSIYAKIVLINHRFPWQFPAW